MNKTLATFMSVAITGLILGSLLIGTVYQSLSSKNDEHQDLLRNEYQLKNN